MGTEEKAVENILKQLETAWNTSDSRAWAAHFAEDATFIHIYGGQLDGRAAIEGAHRNIFDTIYKGSRMTVTLRSMRLLRPDVAVVLTRGLVLTAQGNEVDTRPTMVFVNESGKWQIVAFQNTRISEVPGAAATAAKPATQEN
jgi:uncharacterized protein (TIGR02246 family)